jgi:glycosyltransferase involved in cell wall biosynthesis
MNTKIIARDLERSKTQKIIFFIAALPTMHRDYPRFLAAHKKIFFLLDVIHSIGCKIVFINSAPDMVSRKEAQLTDLKLRDGICLPSLIPATYKNNNCGRLINIQQSKILIDLAADMFGKPDVIWCYNAYAFEMRSARYGKARYGSKVILEFEDWHFSRKSYYDPKAILDWIFWRRAVSSIAYCFAVNEWLKKIMAKHNVSCDLLPGILMDEILQLKDTFPPFRRKNTLGTVRCGYFGGLSTEKGAGRILDLMQLSVDKKLCIEWCVSGKGELESDFLKLSKKFPHSFKFFGLVSDSELSKLVGSVDVIINPHDEMPGVFPFKVLESVASGRLVISTPLKLPCDFDWLSSAIIMSKFDFDRWLDLIINSRSLYRENQEKINVACAKAEFEFGFSGMTKKISHVLDINETSFSK